MERLDGTTGQSSGIIFPMCVYDPDSMDHVPSMANLCIIDSQYKSDISTIISLGPSRARREKLPHTVFSQEL